MNKLVKYGIFLFLVLNTFIFFSQTKKKETLYILFDSREKGNKCIETDTGDLIFYIQPTIDASYFKHKNSSDTRKLVRYKNFKPLLITKITANQKVVDYLKNKSKDFEQSTGEKGLPPIPPYHYNSYFEKIYIYEKIDKTSGVLYEVSWNYAIQ